MDIALSLMDECVSLEALALQHQTKALAYKNALSACRGALEAVANVRDLEDLEGAPEPAEAQEEAIERDDAEPIYPEDWKDKVDRIQRIYVQAQNSSGEPLDKPKYKPSSYAVIVALSRLDKPEQLAHYNAYGTRKSYGTEEEAAAVWDVVCTVFGAKDRHSLEVLPGWEQEVDTDGDEVYGVRRIKG